jgi:alginate O-acetyltransferase complex protein AlgI
MVLEWIDIIKVGVVAAVLFLSHWFMRNSSVKELAHKLPWWMLGIAWAFMLILLAVAQGSGEQFIYFQF